MNENEIMVAGGNLPAATGQMTVATLKEQVHIIQQVLHGVMKKGTHYDALPGCGDKPVLLKAGAEKICMVFRIGIEPEVERVTDGFDTFFHIRARLFDQRTGNTLGYGVGDGSTAESKWAWRKAVCHEEFEATLETRRRIHWQQKYANGRKQVDKAGNPVCEAVEQVRQNPADIINTVLKMAVKRAEVDGIRKVTACSDVFDQDLDEEHIREAVGVEPEQPAYTQPQRKSQTAQQTAENNAGNGDSGADVITDGQRKRLYAIGKGKGLSNDEMSFLVYDIAGVNRSDEIPRAKYDEVVAAYEAAEPGKILPQ